jgi:hypothetical protein
MKTNTDPAAAWAALAPFAPEMFDALRAITHPMASDEDLQVALDLLAEINAAIHLILKSSAKAHSPAH